MEYLAKNVALFGIFSTSASWVKKLTGPHVGPGPLFAHPWSRLFLLLFHWNCGFFTFCSIFGMHCRYYFCFAALPMSMWQTQFLNLQSWDVHWLLWWGLSPFIPNKQHQRDCNQSWHDQCASQKMTQIHVEVDKCVIFPFRQHQP